MLRDSLRFLYYALSSASPAASPSGCKSLSTLLPDYETPGILPPSARIDRTLRPQDQRPWNLWDMWKYPAFAVGKVACLVRDIVAYNIWGPRRRTWGIEMTIINSLMRDVSRHSALADIAMVRMVMGLAGLVPLPADALVTPVTFRVRKRNLRGIIQVLDAQETGQRELSGEWIAGKKLWQALQSDHRSMNRQVDEESILVQSTSVDGCSERHCSRVVLYIHGGQSSVFRQVVTILVTAYRSVLLFQRCCAENDFDTSFEIHRCSRVCHQLPSSTRNPISRSSARRSKCVYALDRRPTSSSGERDCRRR